MDRNKILLLLPIVCIKIHSDTGATRNFVFDPLRPIQETTAKAPLSRHCLRKQNRISLRRRCIPEFIREIALTEIFDVPVFKPRIASEDKDEGCRKSHHPPLLLSANPASYPATVLFSFSTLSTDKTVRSLKMKLE